MDPLERDSRRPNRTARNGLVAALLLCTAGAISFLIVPPSLKMETLTSHLSEADPVNHSQKHASALNPLLAEIPENRPELRESQNEAAAPSDELRSIRQRMTEIVKIEILIRDKFLSQNPALQKKFKDANAASFARAVLKDAETAEIWQTWLRADGDENVSGLRDKTAREFSAAVAAEELYYYLKDPQTAEATRKWLRDTRAQTVSEYYKEGGARVEPPDNITIPAHDIVDGLLAEKEIFGQIKATLSQFDPTTSDERTVFRYLDGRVRLGIRSLILLNEVRAKYPSEILTIQMEYAALRRRENALISQGADRY